MKYKLDREGSSRVLKDLRLREIHLGIRDGVLTGNPFLDKPWVVNFVMNENAQFNLHDTLYNTFRKIALENLNDDALYVQHNDKIYTYRKLLELVDQASVGLQRLGVNENSKVGLFLNNTIEEAVSLLALSKLGALQKYVDYMKDPESMRHSVQEINLDLLIMDEIFLPLVPIVNEKGLPVIVANNSKEYEEYTSFNSLYSSNIEEVTPALYVPQKNTITINSTGTTGPSKPIKLSDFILNGAAQKVLYMDYPISKGNVMVKMIPPQIGLGLITSLYTGLISGALVALIRGDGTPAFSKNLNKFVNDFPQFIEKYHFNPEAKLNIFTASIFARKLILDEEVTDLSRVGSILAAGSKISVKDLTLLDEVGKTKGLTVPVSNGYGQNEVAGAATLNGVEHNLNGSGGFPTIGTDILIVEPDTKEVLDINQEGLILEATDTHFLGYDNLPEKTKNADVVLEDGSVWFNTQDLGEMNEQGFVTITGRLARVATREDFKYSLEVIEDTLKGNLIKDCGIICFDGHGSSDYLVSFVTSDIKDSEVLKQKIFESGCLAPVAIPDEFIVIDEIPYKNGKIDFKGLENIYKQLNGSARTREL